MRRVAWILITLICACQTPTQAEPVRLLPRIVPQDFVAEGVAVGRSDLPGTVTMLAIDYADSVRFAVQDDLTRWGKGSQELFPLALGNLAQQPFELESTEMEDYTIEKDRVTVKAPEALLEVLTELE